MSNGGAAPTDFANASYVRLRMPGLDFGEEWGEMVQFYLDRKEALLAGYSEATDHGVWMIFCFHKLTNAEDFAERFSGEVIASRCRS